MGGRTRRLFPGCGTPWGHFGPCGFEFRFNVARWLSAPAGALRGHLNGLRQASKRQARQEAEQASTALVQVPGESSEIHARAEGRRGASEGVVAAHGRKKRRSACGQRHGFVAAPDRGGAARRDHDFRARDG